MSDTPENEQPKSEAKGVMTMDISDMPEMPSPDGETKPPPAPPQEPAHESKEVGSYADIQGEVNKHFAGSWVDFLRAVRNPVEIMYFVFDGHFERDRTKFEAWGKRQSIPEDWIPRFYSALSPSGELIVDDAAQQNAGGGGEAAEPASGEDGEDAPDKSEEE